MARDELFARIAEGERERERERIAPHDQIALLRESRLGALRVPVALGGAGASVRELFETLIALAQADANVAQIVRAHFAFVEQVLLVPDAAFQERWLAPVAAGEIYGNAVTEIGGQQAGDFVGLSTRIAPSGDGDGGYLIDGTKYYSTGTLYSDRVWVWGVTPEGVPASAVVPVDRDGVTVEDDWDGFGQRLTGTGTTRFAGVRAAADEVLLSDPDNVPPRLPVGAFLQLWLTATVAGAVRSLRDEAVTLLRDRRRGHTHGAAALPREDPVLLQAVGQIASDAWAIEATVLSAAEAIDRANADVAAGRADSGAVHAASKRAAEAKVVVDRLALRSASLLFEAGGASATKASAGLDRHWRNIRTLASHNPTPLKAYALGDFVVNGATLPDNTYF
ncbi:acyl-CoA dehydrogenase family protein [Conexibacter stalactiti]|uniref:Acyl-CoA dehydrogenase family protein n=1 Tax=Conexibacter stalactiti TaxID=1940611 RepID=A0ABU4HMA5_9ACTN|nr:acyl-CoA dehydrogenase family protein [Conexibacter stalactiti]MDW5593849.1 acyl-CoA dehydrogenase family protein [Conexibacter stalactiti]MEC5034491.1 acyl-CoA dehydrogenase family protein [Conexibacter stalactiti]